MKRRSLLLAILMVLMIQWPVFADHLTPPSLWIHGDYAQVDVSPFIQNKRTMVPLRLISEKLGYDVQWDQKTKGITIQNPTGDSLSLNVGDRSILTQNGPVAMDTAATIKDDRTFVPLRAVAEVFGEKVDWDKGVRTAVVGEGYESPYFPNFSEKTLPLVLDGKTLGNVRGFADSGMLFVDYRDIAKLFNFTPSVDKHLFSNFDDDLDIILKGKNGYYLSFNARYVTSSSGFNFAQPDADTYRIDGNRYYIPFNLFCDARHMRCTLKDGVVKATTIKSNPPMPIYYTAPQVPYIFYGRKGPFTVQWNGTDYMINVGEKGKDKFMTMNKHMDYVFDGGYERKYKNKSQDFYEYMALGYNNHFYIHLTDYAVRGFASD